MIKGGVITVATTVTSRCLNCKIGPLEGDYNRCPRCASFLMVRDFVPIQPQIESSTASQTKFLN